MLAFKERGMAATPADPRLARFLDCTLDLCSGELRQNGRRFLLPEQPFRILSLLIRQPGALVTRDELRRELWPDDTFVDFEHGLNAAIKRLREALGDSASTPRFIETLPRRGYRFIGGLEDGRTVPPHDGAASASLAMPESSASVGRRSDRRGTRWVVAASAATVLTVVAGVLASLGFRESFRADVARDLTRLTSTSGLNVDPALSPDGSLLAYASDRAGAGGFDIWVQPVGGSDPLRLTSDAADEAEPSFSPDGSEVVFSRRDHGLYLVGTLGGEPRLIVRAPWARSPRFSPDGRWIVYWTGFPASVIAGGIPDALGNILIVPSGGGVPRELPVRVASARYPIWSPDGERILFLGEENTDEKLFDWYLVRSDGTDLVNTHAVQAIQAAGLRDGPPIPGAWSAQQDAVLFATNDADSSSVWQIGLSRSTGRVNGSPQRLTFGTAGERSPSIAASGRVAFTSVVENVDVWRVPVDASTGVATGPLERVTDSTARDRLASVTADGRTVAFISSRTKHDEVWVRELETGRERQITHAGSDDATLSGDGSRIAFATAKGGASRLEIIESSGGPPVPLCEGCNIPADWSPDGARVLFGRGMPTRLFAYDVSSGRQTELFSHPKWNLHGARFSSDGRWVAFHTTNSPNVRQVYAAPAFQGTRVTPKSWVPIVTDHGCHPSWSHDDAMLYHFSFRDGAFCPWVQSVDPVTRHPIGGPRPVVHLHNARLRAATGAAATNDVQAGYFYFTATETTGNIWMLDAPRS
jgi:Tol biopolymer transport system component/DNA-binding winged helix-turn-helix (wHTH) protein